MLRLDEECIAHLTLCTLCFSAEADLELMNCGDRLCFDCLERYLRYTLRASMFGIRPVVVECPLCKCPMESEDWEPFVDDELLDLYDKCMSKDRQIKRDCPHCQHDQGFLVSGELDGGLLRMAVSGEHCRSIVSRLEAGALSSAYTVWLDVAGPREQSEQSGLSEQSEQSGQREHVTRIVINQQLLSKIHSASPQSFFKCQLVALEKAPLVRCEACGAVFCLCCGSKAHTNPCMDNYAAALDKDNRPCPRCFAIINRDPDGCNEMQCEVCGKAFCWQCLKPWSHACGIYQCTNPLFTVDTHPTTRKGDARKAGKRSQDAPAWELYDRIKGRQ